MRKKIIWERVHRLEQEIAALMKIDNIVTSKVHEVAERRNSPEISNNMQNPLKSEETIAPSSFDQNKSIMTIHPPPKARCANTMRSGRHVHKPKSPDEAESEQQQQRQHSAETHRKARSLPKYMQNRTSPPERQGRPHSPFTTTLYRAEMTPTLDGANSSSLVESLHGQCMEHGEGAVRPDTPGLDSRRGGSDACAFPRSCAQSALAHCCDNITCKYELVLQRLSEETRRRSEVEKMLGSVQDRLERSSSALTDANRARAAALDVAQQLRDKYEVLRNARRQAQNHLLSLKAQNAALAEQLEAEASRRKELAATLEGESGAHQGLRQLLEDERRGREALRGEAEAEATRAAELRRRVSDLEEQAGKERSRVQSLEREVAAERLKRRSAEDPELRSVLEGAMRPLRENLEEKTRALVEAETRARQLQQRLEEAEAEAKRAATAATAAATAAANAEAAARARERVPPADDPAVRQLLATETRRLAEELQRCAEDARSQHARCAQLEAKLREQQMEEERRFHAAEEQFARARSTLADKEHLVQRERDELEQLVHDLTESLRAQKKRVCELVEASHRREGLLRTQTEALASKDEQLRLASSEGVALRERAAALQAEAARLASAARSMRKANEDLLRRQDAHRRCSRCDALHQRATKAEQELEQWKSAVQTERDNHLVKDKIIEDQTATILRIKQQRQQEQDAAGCERQTLQYDLAQERRSTQKLRNDLAAVHRRCQQLQERADSLEEELTAAAGSGAEAEQHRRMLEELEEDVREQKRSWEEQTARLSKEKDQALQAAQYSAKKLQETMNDFEHQVASHRKVQSMLTSHLSQKEKELLEVHKTVRLLNHPDGHSFAKAWAPEEGSHKLADIQNRDTAERKGLCLDLSIPRGLKPQGAFGHLQSCLFATDGLSKRYYASNVLREKLSRT